MTTTLSVDIVFDTFYPNALPESDESVLARLDTLVNPGLSDVELRAVFIQCGICKAMTTRRNVHYHSCAEVSASVAFAPLDRVSLLHCVGTGGLKPESFRDIMSVCGNSDCSKFMTYRSSLHHDCILEQLYCQWPDIVV